MIDLEQGRTLDEVERALADLWVEVLQMDRPPTAKDDFFNLGGDSMTMVLLEFRIKEEFHLSLPTGSVLSTPTLGDLAALLRDSSQHR